MLRFSATVRLGKTPRPSGTVHRPDLVKRSDDRLVTSWPLKRTVPLVGRSRPEATFNRVDLPAPLGPSRAMTVPAATDRSTPWIASMVP